MGEQADAPRVAFLLAGENLTESRVLDSIALLKEGGAQVDLVGPASGEIQLLRRTKDGVTSKSSLSASRTLNEIDPAKYRCIALSAALLENGALRIDSDMQRLLQDAQAKGKPFICFPESSQPEGTCSRAFELKRLLVDSWQNWNAIDAPRLGAALAYYTLLSLAPLVILMVAMAGVAFPRAMVQSELILPVRDLMGSQAAELVGAVFDNAKTATGFLAGAISVLMLLVGASGVFLELRDSLDTVWGVKPRYGTGLISLVRERLFAFLVIIGTGLVLLLFLFISTAVAAPAHALLHIVPVEVLRMVPVEMAVSFAAVTFLFALIYKLIPTPISGGRTFGSER